MGKNAPQGPLPKDRLLDETVLFKTVIGLKWIIWGSGKNCLERLDKYASQGPPPEDPLLGETIFFKTVIGLKWATSDQEETVLLHMQNMSIILSLLLLS